MTTDTPLGPSPGVSTAGDRPPLPARLICLVDGFNVYHSLDDARKGLLRDGKPCSGTKWLDLKSLLSSMRSNVRGVGRVELIDVDDFTALANHIEMRKPGVVARHKAYIEALKSTGVQVVLGRFKAVSNKKCACGALVPRHEEKETDVSISVKLIELLVRDDADAIAIVSGDTDLVPAIKTARSLFPTKSVGCLFPFARANDELRNVSNFYASFGRDQYAKHQLPASIEIPGRRPIVKPSAW